MSPTRIGLVGAGAIGRAHLVGAASAQGVEVVGIADPNPAAEALAREFGIPWFSDHRTLLEKTRPDGAVIATPNALHASIAMAFITEGKAVLVEKPITDTVEEGLQFVQSATAAGVPILVGHHRRHNPIIQQARAMVRDGTLGRLVAVNVMATFLKPDSYFDQGWRRTNAGGPVLINLIHEIDLIRFVCGEIKSLQATTSNAVRGFDVEDTAGTLLRLENGALVTITLSDATSAPWSWDLSSGENSAFARAAVESHFICGTDASLALPTLRLWRYRGERGWFHPLLREDATVLPMNPYVEQMRHFGAVVRREEQPLVDGLDATQTLAVTVAVRRAAETGAVICF